MSKKSVEQKHSETGIFAALHRAIAYKEFKNLFDSSGFKLSRIIPTKDGVCIIEGIRL
jgi:hypothetical protein